MREISSKCIKRHFGAGGEPVEIGSIHEREPDGVFFEAVEVEAEPEKVLKVATPKRQAKDKA